MKTSRSLWITISLLLPVGVLAQEKRMEQDASLNNLQHAADYQTCAPGSLGTILRRGQGQRDMVLIAGAGFGGNVFADFMDRFREDFTMVAVTLPGFDGTPAPPMPPPGTSYGARSWTCHATNGLARLIAKEELDQPVVVAHWLTAPAVALQLAIKHPDRVSAIVVISGRASGIRPSMRLDSEAKRAQWVDTMMAPLWFKSVTRETWDDNNFYPHDYARHPVRGLQLWRIAQRAPLSVWVRYLCESLTEDLHSDLQRVRVPVLIVRPGFDDEMHVDPAWDYMRHFCYESWEGITAHNDQITLVTIPDARAFIMDDQPEALHRQVERFLARPS